MPSDASAAIELLAARIDALLLTSRSSDVLEREVKVLGAAVEVVEQRLAELEIPLVFAGSVRTARLRVPGKPENCPLKYRVLEGLPPSLILKGPVLAHPRFKLRREITWDLRGETTPLRVARALGGEVGDEDVKRRHSYTHDERPPYHVDIDWAKGQDPVVEVEGATDAAILHALEELWLDGHAKTALSGGQLRGS